MKPPSTGDPDRRARDVGAAARRVLETFDLGHWRVTRASGDWQPIERDEPWPGGVGPVAFERHTVTVPPAWPLAQVRLVLAPGGRGRAVVHSKHGLVTFELAPDGSEVPVPALAFGLRLEADDVPRDASADPPRFGGARLELLDADVLGGASDGRAEAGGTLD